MLALLLACSRVPDAPEDLNQLGSYLFTHFEASNPQYLINGIDNLYEWVLLNKSDLEEGYRIQNINEQAVLDLGFADSINLEDLVGAATGTELHYSVSDVLEALLLTSPMDLSPDSYGYFETVWSEEPECFIAQNCPTVEYDSEVENLFPLGIVMENKIHGKYRWVNSSYGDAVISRRYTLESVSNQSWLNIEQDYGLSIQLPMSFGTMFIDIEWVVAKLGELSVPEDYALNLAIDAMRTGRQNLEIYMDELGTYTPVAN